MRYYDIAIFDPKGNLLQPNWQNGTFNTVGGGGSGGTSPSALTAPPQTSSFGSSTTFTSHPGGIFNPNALNIGFEGYVIPAGDSQKNLMTLTIWGLPVKMLGQASNFNPNNQNDVYTVEIKAGMSVSGPGLGLPLAVSQAPERGYIYKGYIQQAVGNWEGTEQTLTFLLGPNPDVLSLAPKGGIQLSWQFGDTIQTAVTNMIQPIQSKQGESYNVTFRGGAGLTFNLMADFPFFGNYETLDQAIAAIAANANAIYDNSQGTPGTLPSDDETITVTKNATTTNQYPGLNFLISNLNIDVWDTPSTKVVVLKIGDMIGQPAWVDKQYLTVKLVMRGDIVPGMQVQFPPAAQIGAPWAQIPINVAGGTGLAFPNTQATFQGIFSVQEVYNFGNYRDPGGSAWCSVLKIYPSNSSAPSAGP